MGKRYEICGRCIHWVRGFPFNSHCGINGKPVTFYHRCDCAGPKNGVLAFHKWDNGEIEYG